ncbi:MAG: hypothetical protein NTU48_09070 [Legionellales bacterium]|nr:hypothetical protein [Legionellales bacterium]
MSAAFALQAQSLRGKRFCEVIISAPGNIMEFYNTINLNDCPEVEWKQITVRDIRKETGAVHVVLSGPRKFCVDGVKNADFLASTPRTFHHLAMRKSALLQITMRETLHGSRPYHEHHVDRKTTWVFAVGSRVYELIDPAGAVYVMQSFMLMPGIETEKDLGNLGEQLKLPRGWIFKTGILKKGYDLVSFQNKAVVLEDSMKNNYQKATQDFLL